MTTHENISYELKEVKWFMQRRLSALRNVTFQKLFWILCLPLTQDCQIVGPGRVSRLI